MLTFFKKRDKNNPNNYRGTNLLNTTFKFSTRIIDKNLWYTTRVLVSEVLYECGFYYKAN